jgi:hypothetical protein
VAGKIIIGVVTVAVAALLGMGATSIAYAEYTAIPRYVTGCAQTP